jgi:hypothetical protein
MASRAEAVDSAGFRERARERRSRSGGTSYAPGRDTRRGRSVIRESLNIRVALRSVSRPTTYQRPFDDVIPHGSRVRSAAPR